MVRVEIAIPFIDKNYQPVDKEEIGKILDLIGTKTRGYRCSRQEGFWLDDQDAPYQGDCLILVTDTTFEIANWFRSVKSQWEISLNQQELYLAIYIIEWI